MRKLIFMLIVILAMTITPMFAETVSPVDPGLSTIVSFNTAPVVESTLTVQAAEIINSEFTIVEVLSVLVLEADVISNYLGYCLGINPREKRGDLAIAGFV